MREFFDNLRSQMQDLMAFGLTELGEKALTVGDLLQLVLIVVGALVISKIFQRFLQRVAASNLNLSDDGAHLIGRLAQYTLLTLSVIIGLDVIGFDLTSLAVIAGALGVGIGFGLQTIASNFVSGLVLLFERNMRVGDFVELQSGVRGTIREINMRSTLINTPDNVDVLVPNQEFIVSQVNNWTLRERKLRFHISFGVAYGSDKDKVRNAALEAAGRVEMTMHKPRPPEVWLVGFGDSSLDFELVVWVDAAQSPSPGAITASYLWEIETSLREHGIEIPFPQRDLHLKSGFDKIK